MTSRNKDLLEKNGKVFVKQSESDKVFIINSKPYIEGLTHSQYNI